MRTLIRGHRTYAALAVTSLALAVGATLTVFTVVNALWLTPMGIAEPDRLVMLVDERPGDVDAALFWGIETSDQWAMFDAVAGQVVTTGALAGQRPHMTLAATGRDV
jgi:hypothetical protein